jgi:spore coat polysaccharide biosynthesis protein SpsF
MRHEVAADRTEIRILVQARMNSKRFPGKVLAPLAGTPLIAHVLERCGRAFGAARVVLATSDRPSDNPLALYAETLGYPVFRGDLDNVLGRFQACLAQYPCDWFVRVTADSPLIDPQLIERVASRRRPDDDLVSNVHPRTFPAGQSVEVVRADGFARLDAAALTPEEREHVTLVFYRRAERFRIRSVISRDPQLGREHLAVDTVEELRELEGLLAAGPAPQFADALEPAQ